MFSKTLILVLFSAFVGINCSPFEYFEDKFDKTKANELVDTVVKQVKQRFATTLEPYHLKNINVNFTIPFINSNVSGTVNMTERYVTGLADLQRVGDSRVGANPHQFVSQIRFGNHNLRVHTHASIKFVDLFPKVVIEADINDIDVNVTVGADKDGKAVVIGFKVSDITDIKIHLPGFEEFEPIANSAEERTLKSVVPNAHEIIDIAVNDFVAKTFKTQKYPFSS